MRDVDIRPALVKHLQQSDGQAAAHGDARVWSEMAIELGASRVDVCLINDALSGFEIKSPRDNFGRLARQIDHYERVLDFASIVVSAQDIDKARIAVPSSWGIITARDTSCGIVLKVRRSPKFNRKVDALSLAQLLWRDEALAQLQTLGLAEGLSKSTRWAVWDRLVERVDFPTLKSIVRASLKARPRRGADMRFELGDEKLLLHATSPRYPVLSEVH